MSKEFEVVNEDKESGYFGFRLTKVLRPLVIFTLQVAIPIIITLKMRKSLNEKLNWNFEVLRYNIYNNSDCRKIYKEHFHKF